MADNRPKKWTLDAIDPFGDDGAVWKVWVDQAHVDGLSRHRVDPRFYRLLLLSEVLSDPTAIFQGWEREGQDGGLCYVGSPAKDYRSESIEVPPPPGKVFLAFVTSRGKVSEWRWEDSDEDDPHFPKGYNKGRFTRIAWPTIVML